MNPFSQTRITLDKNTCIDDECEELHSVKLLSQPAYLFGRGSLSWIVVVILFAFVRSSVNNGGIWGTKISRKHTFTTIQGS